MSRGVLPAAATWGPGSRFLPTLRPPFGSHAPSGRSTGGTGWHATHVTED